MAKNNFMAAMIKADLPKSMYSQDEKIKKEIIVLDFLKKFIPPLATDERNQLEQNILQFGCKDPLIVWETQKGIIEPQSESKSEPCYVLLDGHNRHEICQKFGIDFRVNLIEIETLEKAQDFMIDHQLGRRNLSVEQMAYLRGMKYLALKQGRENNELKRDNSGKFKTISDGGGKSYHNGENTENDDTENRSGKNYHNGKKEKLSEQLAKEFNVGEKTIRLDADYAKGIERLPIEIKNEVLQGKSSLKKSEIIEIGKLKDSETISEQIEEIITNSSDKKESSKNVESKKDKLLDFLKSHLQTPEDCDDIISEIKSLKKGLQKNSKG
jgi:hypothetical protein